MHDLTVLSLLIAVSVSAALTLPELPPTFDTTIPEFSACTVTLAAEDDLQAAIDAANPNEVICLQAGSTRVGNFILRSKDNPDNLWITIRTSTADEDLPRGTRVSPAQSSLLAQIISPNTAPAIASELSAHHYLLIGLDVTHQGPFSYGLIQLGADEQTTKELVPAWIFVERCWIHGPMDKDCRRGVALNSQYSNVQDCYIEEMRGGDDTQAVGGWNGLGPFMITNNYLSATGENILFGGAGTTVPEEVSSDITIRGNYFWKDPDWLGTYTVKNLIEIKTGRRVLIDSNVFENMNSGNNNGLAILLSIVDVLPKVTQDTLVHDVTITNNLVKNTIAGFGCGSSVQPWYVERVRVENNLFIDVKERDMLTLFAKDLWLNHNTFYATPSNAAGTAISMGYVVNVNMTFTNNICVYRRYGIIGDGQSSGISTLEYYTAPVETLNERFKANVLMLDENDPQGSTFVPGYPNQFYFPRLDEVQFTDIAGNDFTLAVTSPFKNNGTDGRDIGVDYAVLMAKITGVLEGTWTAEAAPVQAPLDAPVTGSQPQSSTGPQSVSGAISAHTSLLCVLAAVWCAAVL